MGHPHTQEDKELLKQLYQQSLHYGHKTSDEFIRRDNTETVLGFGQKIAFVEISIGGTENTVWAYHDSIMGREKFEHDLKLYYTKTGEIEKLNRKKISIKKASSSWAWGVPYFGESVYEQGNDPNFNFNLGLISAEDDNQKHTTLENYLFHELNLNDISLETVLGFMSNFETGKISPQELIRRIESPSFHKVFCVKTKDGKKIILKITDNETKAMIEQASNYFLSKSGLNFIVPNNSPKPYSYCGLYITTQNYIEGREPNINELPYFLYNLAMLHSNSAEIIKNSHFSMPKSKLMEFEDIFDLINVYKNAVHGLNIAKIRSIKNHYDEAKEESESRIKDNKIITHGDIKKQNMLIHEDENKKCGFFLDLEGMCFGDPLYDLGYMLNDPKFNLSSEEKKHYAAMYHYFFCQETKTEYSIEKVNDLMDQLKGPMLIRAANSIAWNLVYIAQEGETAKDKIEFLMRTI